ncbi:cysteine-rich receptor protein [Salix suchowensis]|nr:cysteine-rich receptor protein [Salix suchowensis]
MARNTVIITLLLFLSSHVHSSNSQETWIRAGYWDSVSELPVSDINSALFTHLVCGFSNINYSTYQIHINSSKEPHFSFSSMINQSSYRKSFIESSIYTARIYGFDGLDLSVGPSISINMTNLGTLFDEWRVAIASDSRKSGQSQLLLVMSASYSPAQHPIGHLIAYDYHVPAEFNFTGAHAALYGPSNWANTDEWIMDWLRGGLSASKLVLGLPFHGYAWRLVNPNEKAIGAPSSGPYVTRDGSMGYKSIKSFIKNYGYGAAAVYNSTYVMNLFVFGSAWINFDDVESIKAKISYAKENNLSGYSVFQLSNDDNWILSRAAQGKDEDGLNKRKVLVIILVSIAVVFLMLGTIICCYFRRKILSSKEIAGRVQKALSAVKIKVSATRVMNGDAPHLQPLSFDTIAAATNNFSSDNKLGAGGFGSVYKGKLPDGKEIAVKRLSKTSTLLEFEFKNELTLTGKLQHVNVVTVLGFCNEREEKMLIYEYMPNKSLDFYIYDPIRRYILDWRKRVQIIEGLTQGLLYLQEFSNFTIIHRDIKSSNILLDEDMNPKISDFGMARLFRKDDLEANTRRIVGTYGYVPPEYVRKGIYSMKYDVYSFGVLLLQIISGKRSTCYYGSDENWNLLEYAYELWKNGEGVEFFDPSLDDSSSSCKLTRCLQIALLCVQENPLHRPSMLKISSMLKNENAPIATPKRPSFSTKRDEEDSVITNKIYSVNDATISDLEPR